MKRNKQDSAMRATHRYFAEKAIEYHVALQREYDGWAEECGWDPQSLRRASELAIRTRHHEAFFESEWGKATGNQPDIFSLSLGSVNVYYTVEPHAVLIRGYHWEIDHEPLDDYEGGGLYLDFGW